MKALKILANDSCPKVYFDTKQNILEISGNSMPEDASGFYMPIINWLDNYAESSNEDIEFVFHMNLLNTSSTKMFIDIFKKINKIMDMGNVDVSVKWYYNNGDDDLQEVGMDFKEFSKAPFELVAFQ